MKERKNLEIRNNCKEKGIYLWQIADYLKISETHFIRTLRKELPDDKKQEILSIIDELALKEEK